LRRSRVPRAGRKLQRPYIAADLTKQCCDICRTVAQTDINSGTHIDSRAIASHADAYELHLPRVRYAVDRVQELVLSLDTLDLEEGITATVDAFGAIPDPQCEIDRVFLISLMLDVAVTIVRSLHRRLPGPPRCSCHLLLAKFATGLVDRRATGPHQALMTWLEEFERHYRRGHPPSRALAAATLIRADPARRWTVEALADRVGCKPRALTQEFRLTFPVTIHLYLGVARLLAVYERLGTDEKISAVADDAGYRSPKDFYRVVRACTGLTPRMLRLLPRPHRVELRLMLKAALTHRAARGRRAQARAPALPGDVLKAVQRRGLALAERMRAARLKPVKATLQRKHAKVDER
jgi:AraC-like DNA-binding protein